MARCVVRPRTSTCSWSMPRASMPAWQPCRGPACGRCRPSSHRQSQRPPEATLADRSIAHTHAHKRAQVADHTLMTGKAETPCELQTSKKAEDSMSTPMTLRWTSSLNLVSNPLVFRSCTRAVCPCVTSNGELVGRYLAHGLCCEKMAFLDLW